ncbi:MAG: hypothetical protein AAGB51_14385 [Planctomycetota bacterium]
MQQAQNNLFASYHREVELKTRPIVHRAERETHPNEPVELRMDPPSVSPWLIGVAVSLTTATAITARVAETFEPGVLYALAESAASVVRNALG